MLLVKLKSPPLPDFGDNSEDEDRGQYQSRYRPIPAVPQICSGMRRTLIATIRSRAPSLTDTKLVTAACANGPAMPIARRYPGAVAAALGGGFRILTGNNTCLCRLDDCSGGRFGIAGAPGSGTAAGADRGICVGVLRSRRFSSSRSGRFTADATDPAVMVSSGPTF